MKPCARRALLAALLCSTSFAAPAALDVAGLDRNVDPCRDFYQFANRTWLESTQIPDDRARWGTFEIIAARNEQVLLKAFDEALARPLPPAGSAERKAIQYYASGMDQAAIERAALKPLEPLFARARATNNAAELAKTLAFLHVHGVRAGFSFDVEVDRRDSTRYLAEIEQGGLGLPDRDYYFLDDERSARLRDGYRKHVQRMFELAGDAPEAAARNAASVIALETELARASWTRTERRDEVKNYNRVGLDALTTATPGFPWPQYLAELGAAKARDINMRQPPFFAAFAKLAAERPAAEWQAYLRWQVLHATAEKLPERFEQENFDFFSRQLAGTKVAAPRHRRVIQAMGGPYGEQGLGQVIGRMFVERTFSPEAKARALELVRNVKAALGDRLREVEWMTEETRARSLEKLAAMEIKIGYPDRWRDFSDADVGPYSFADNWLRARAFDTRRDLAKIGTPVDRGEWLLSPHIVNAYYNPTLNEIVFPAAILQPPYFDAKADDAVNYGGIGMVIGHEITHGFDDRGRLYDARGNMREWWTAEDSRRYAERAQRIERQYGGFDGVEGVKVNGKLTLGENISDVGGLKIAYYALQKALKERPAQPIDGLTAEQRFYVSFAQGWRSRARPEWERNSLLTGQHSLPRFRVRGPLAHSPEFARAFSCEASTALLAEPDRANIW
ncbi:MAG TPA: M13 family metallopeptidase [Usitatibacter sp.]|nr:M13 family metallopeptidase [Usitatibacter sp.]